MTARHGQLVLRADGLRVETTAGIEILDDVSFELYAGEVLALVGESGSGKTTSALALLGHATHGIRIVGGSVVLEGRDLLRLKKRELRSLRGARISYVAQDPTKSLNPRHRVKRQIAETLIVHGMSRRDAQLAVKELAASVHLPTDDAFLQRYPFELSGGQQQRVAIAIALVSKPQVVVLDEPTTGLDVTTQARVLNLLRELAQETRTAFVYVTHDLALVDGIADRVAVMYAGRIVESGSRARVFRNPAHPYTSLLLQSVPRLKVRQVLTGIDGTALPPGMRPRGCFFAPRCPLADSHCVAEFPPVTKVEAAHLVRCWHSSSMGAPASQRLRHRRLPENDQLLTVEHLVASYRQGSKRSIVLNDVSFAISPGECLALLGESGSGKTTLGRCVIGLHRPDSGSIRLYGSPLAEAARGRAQAERQRIQIVFQNPEASLNPAETVQEALARPMRLFGHARGSERKEIEDLLDRVRLPLSSIGRYPVELSGGEQQRVAIARALAARPALLVCDEVTSALDVSIQAAIVELLEELRLDGLALLFITHNIALVNSIADRVLILEEGVVREEGRVADVIEHPGHEYTRQLIAAVPELKSACP